MTKGDWVQALLAFAAIVATLGGGALAVALYVVRNRQRRWLLGAGGLFSAAVLIAVLALVAASVSPRNPATEDGRPPLGASSAEDSESGNPGQSPSPSTADSSATSTVTEHPPTPTVRTALPYTADWSSGLDGWFGDTAEWRVTNGRLLAAGQRRGIQMSLRAPISLVGTTDYNIDTDIQFVGYTDAGSISGLASFGVVVRAAAAEGTGYGVGHCVGVGLFSCAAQSSDAQVAAIWDRTDSYNPKALETVPFKPEAGSTYHFRVTVQGNSLGVFIDGAEALNVTDNVYGSGGQVGFWTDRSQIVVENFVVTPVS